MTESEKKELVPEYIKNLKVYQAGKPIEELAREKSLKKISKLASNENPLGPSPFAIKEMTQGLWSLHQYPDMHAFRLKQALSELYNLKHQNIILGNGSEGILAYIARVFVQPGDEVITSEGTFIGFNIMFKGQGAKITKVPLTKDFRFCVKSIAEKITDQIKLIYIANPNNPTGTYITKHEFDYLMKYVPNHVLVVLDEAYFEFATHAENYPNSMDYRYDNVITLRTFSKAYGLAGIRVGYGFGHETLIGHLHKVKLPFEPNYIAQLGACGAIHDRPHLQRTLLNNMAEYQKLLKYLKSNGFSPIESLTNFICFHVGSIQASDWLFEKLLDQGVIIRPLKGNELPHHMRVSVGLPEENLHFMESMDNLISEFRKKFGEKQ
ncbi:MAG: histidinol-phosphate transaminase [Halobacteriovoraceae bacterium]|nr:histidinol-phosphate transaminase [Halobacteriovoraceae bacterium]